MIAGFGVDGQPRSWGKDGAALRPGVKLLVDGLGATMFRLEVDRGNTAWEAANDDADPFHLNWDAFDGDFSTDDFSDLYAYMRYLNDLGVTDIQLSLEGLLPDWMGRTAIGPGMEDEYVETVVAFLLYVRDRAPEPRPVFTRVNPWTEADLGKLESFLLGLDGQVQLARRLVDRMNQFPQLDDIELVLPEASNEEWAADFRSAIKDDPAIVARLAATSFHRYGGYRKTGDWVDASPPMWLTEFNSSGPFQQDPFCYQVDWPDAMDAVGNLLGALQSGVTAGLFYSDVDAPHIHSDEKWESFGLLATTAEGDGDQCGRAGQPSDAELDSFEYVPKPSFYALAHVMRYVRPGAVPVPVDGGGDDVTVIAFRNPDGSVAVVAQDRGDARSVDVQLDLDADGAGDRTWTPTVSTDGSYLVEGSSLAATGGAVTITMPPRSVVTLLSPPPGPAGS
ncbi:MAG: glycoside hydrolase family 30 beta sandwich domain-containing protein [Ilumatobacteraceae bacterium]